MVPKNYSKHEWYLFVCVIPLGPCQIVEGVLLHSSSRGVSWKASLFRQSEKERASKDGVPTLSKGNVFTIEKRENIPDY